MAYIYIKKRLDPIRIPNERAQKIKDRWLGLNDQKKAEFNDLIDLGDWSGEYGRISSIEMERDRVYNVNEVIEDITNEERIELLKKYRPQF